MTAWDPIGVGDVPEAWDEYDSYLNGVAQRLRQGMHDEEEAVMDLTRAPTAHDEHLASALVAWHEWSFRRRGRPPTDWTDDP